MTIWELNLLPQRSGKLTNTENVFSSHNKASICYLNGSSKFAGLQTTVPLTKFNNNNANITTMVVMMMKITILASKASLLIT